MNQMNVAVPADGSLRHQGPELLLAHAAVKARPLTLGAAEGPCRIALVGFGTVGQSVARLLQSRSDERSLCLTYVCNRGIARKMASWTGPDVVWTESMQEILDSDADVVVELMGGLDPAYELVVRALRCGKSVVTANKQLIAHSGSHLLQLASEQGKYLGFGACVAGGVPVLSGLQDGLAGDRIVKIRGILNGTCNYILNRIEQGGISFAEALREAQQAGFAEADPSFDIDGQDAAAKLAILARVGLKVSLEPEKVTCRTIRNLSAIDFAYAKELGCTVRQISTATMKDGQIYAAVGPSLVGNDCSLAKVSGNQNLIVSTGEFGGDTMFGGQGAGGDPTAVAVLSDLMQAAGCRSAEQASFQPARVSSCEATLEVESSHYLRFVVRDRPGIIAALAAVFAKHRLNLHAILQKPGYEKECLPFVITLEPCAQRLLTMALDEIKGFDFLVEPPVSMPIVQ
jgi:homoserine dehydrogenase